METINLSSSCIDDDELKDLKLIIEKIYSQLTSVEPPIVEEISETVFDELFLIGIAVKDVCGLPMSSIGMHKIVKYILDSGGFNYLTSTGKEINGAQMNLFEEWGMGDDHRIFLPLHRRGIF